MTEIRSKISAFITDNLLLGRPVDVAGSTSFLEETWGFSVKDEEMVPDNLDSLSKLESFVGRKLGT